MLDKVVDIVERKSSNFNPRRGLTYKDYDRELSFVIK